MLKASQLRELTREELSEKENELAQQLFTLRLQKVSGQIDNPARVRQVRREMARVLTVLREKELSAA